MSEKKVVAINVLIPEEWDKELRRRVLEESSLEEMKSKSDIIRDILAKEFKGPPIFFGPSDEIKLLSPIGVVAEPPTCSWTIDYGVLEAHLMSGKEEPIRCRVSVLEGDKELWGEDVNITLTKEADLKGEAKRARTVTMPPEVFGNLRAYPPILRVRVSYYSAIGTKESAEASSLLLKVPKDFALRAEVDSLLARGRFYNERELLEESIAAFQEAIEVACERLIRIYSGRGLDKAREYQRILEEVKKLGKI